MQVSTDEVYGHVPEGHSTESDPLAPRSPYSAGKAGGDLQVLAYGTTYGTPVLITRGSNTYGPYQYPEKLIPLFTTNLLDDKPVPVYGDGLQIRDWLHVEDHARGILHVLEHGAEMHVYNVGGGNHRTNLEITRRLLELCGRRFDTHVRHVTDRPGHDRRYAIDASKLARLRLGAADAISATGSPPTVAGTARTKPGGGRSKAASSPITIARNTRRGAHEGHHPRRRLGFAAPPAHQSHQ